MKPNTQPFFCTATPVPNTTTWNPSDKSTNITLSGGNLVATCNATQDGAVRATKSYTGGKHYFELTTGATYVGGDTGLGIATSSAVMDTVGNTVANAVLTYPGGSTYVNGSFNSNTTGTISTNTTVCIAVDLTNNRIWFRLAGGNWNGNAGNNPATNTGGIDISFRSGAAIYPCQSFSSNGASETANFGASAFVNSPPSGFASW